ncbi:NAD-dependent epimerase/dehydratase family protein [Bernardetia sp. OM2101]|uniref:NAD-dependent epimerase/dehydratase family protein n=1 Tax=Bernardetia sp. OM2101 TaxID=3344876 RepID=UPI0035D0CDFD
MDSILIVGANSFLAKYIVDNNTENVVDGIFNLQKPTNSNYNNLFSVQELKNITYQYDKIFLLASFIPYGKMNEANPNLITSNIDLISQVSKNFPSSKIIFASSVSVYGENQQFPLSIDSAFKNPNLYGLSKLAGETIIKNHAKYGIIRFSSLYGIGMNKQTFLPKVIQSAIIKNKITVFGDGSRLQDYFHVADAARLCMSVSEYPQNDTFLGVQGSSVSNLEVVKAIKKAIPNLKINFEGEDKTPSFVYQNKSTSEKLNFTPKYNLETQIKNLIFHEKNN